MTQHVQDLIDKIKSEGIQSAQHKAQEIEKEARGQAEKLLADAAKRAEQIIQQAHDDAKKTKESTVMALQQSSRNMLLSLRKDIDRLFRNIIAQKTGEALSADELKTIIESSIQTFLKENKPDEEIRVTLSESDYKKLKDSALSELQKKVKNPIEFRPSEEVNKGFTISFDGGKSGFDFTDESLVNYLSAYLNDDVNAILKEAI